MESKNDKMDNHDVSPESWERKLLTEILHSYVAEKKRSRFWSYFRWTFFLLLFIVIFVILGSYSRISNVGHNINSHTALVNLAGSIQVDGEVDAKFVNESIRNAFNAPASVGVILRINSPGGSPVQSALIYDEILRLRNANPDKPLIAVVEDIAASGAYYVASAAEKIYVNKSSIVGSIGVLLNGFGFPDLIKKYGIERRLLTAGENKAMLDPFSEVNPEHTKATQEMLNEIHNNFIEAVRNERGDRLSSDPIVFSGMVFTGSKSIQLGLSDDFGSVNSVARNFFEVENIVDYTIPTSLFEKFTDEIRDGVVKIFTFGLLNQEGGIPIH